MVNAVPLVEIWRGSFLESVHNGHAVVCGADGQIIEAWGDPSQIILPRSSSKMIQALPLVESGAADAFGLTTEQLALSCASHNAAAIHTDRVAKWLSDLELTDDALRCGPQMPNEKNANYAMIKKDGSPCRYHNNCSGKHSGFLTLNKHLNGGPEYVEIDHPVQSVVKQRFEEVTQETSTGFGIDGCSAPNHASTVHGLARAMASFASAPAESAMNRLFQAMVLHPDLVAGEGRACTELMRAMDGRVAIKTGAEGVFVAIIPEQKIGIALKIADGATRASECAMASLLVRYGVLNPDHPSTLKRRNAVIKNFAGIATGYMHPSSALL